MRAEQRKPTRDLIQLIVDEIDTRFIGNALIVEDDGSYTITTCNTKWITKGNVLTIGANTYRVNEITNFESINISCIETPAVAPSILNFEVPVFYHWHGSLKATSSELIQIKKASLKLPMIYLYQPISEKHDFDDENTIGMESDCTFFIMGETNFKDWNTINHEKYAVNPMRNLTFAFIDALLNYTIGVEHQTLVENKFEIFDRIRWGKYYFEGSAEKFFADDVSGVELKVNIPFLKKYCC